MLNIFISKILRNQCKVPNYELFYILYSFLTMLNICNINFKITMLEDLKQFIK